MRPVRRFSVLCGAATRRLNRLRDLADMASLRSASEFGRTNLELSFVTVELHTAISNFARAYFLSCTLSPITVNGTKVICHPTIVTFSDAIDAAMKACRYSMWIKGSGTKIWSRRDEPPWHQPGTLIDSCKGISCSHHSSIVAAFAVPTQVFDHLTKFRNFYAHRNQTTSSIARSVASSYSISTTEHPSQILLTPAYGRPQPLIMDWIDDARNVIELLCQ